MILLRTTPYGNSIVADFAIAAIDGEDLGKDNITDVLAVSFSSTDYIGHNFGANSKEVQDTYLRLDQDLKRLFDALDSKVGKGEYTVFLTADHGAIHVPAYLQSVKIPADYVNTNADKQKLNNFMFNTFKSTELIENVSNNQVFLNHAKLKELNLKLSEVQDAIVSEIITYENVDKAYSGSLFTTTNFTTGIEELIQNGFNQKRSGDVVFEYNPATISYSKTGSTHGSGLNYDTHIPLLFFGKGINKGSSYQKTRIIDIAPTMSALLGISFPNGNTGSPIEMVLKN